MRVLRSTNNNNENNNNNSNSDFPNIERQKEVIFSATIEIPTRLRDRINTMGGQHIRIVIQKQLQDTDVNKNQGRLLIPAKKLMNDFTTNEEKELLSQQDEAQKNKKGMNVMIIDPLLRLSDIELKTWKNGSGTSYCLMSKWNSFVQQNSLESGDFIQLWSFRINNVDAAGLVTSNLCFALVKLDISEGIFKFL